MLTTVESIDWNENLRSTRMIFCVNADANAFRIRALSALRHGPTNHFCVICSMLLQQNSPEGGSSSIVLSLLSFTHKMTSPYSYIQKVATCARAREKLC